MTSVRPYREATSPQRAIETMVAERGARFDPSLLDLFTEDPDAILEELDLTVHRH